MTVECLVQKGFMVFAACLTQEGVTRWQEKKLRNLRAFKLDVTKLNEILACAELVEKESPHGL